MHKYSIAIEDPANTVHTNAKSLRVKFKNAREVSAQLKKLTLTRAVSFLKNVINRKDCIKVTRYAKKCGRTAQAKKYEKGSNRADSRGKWPVKPCQAFIGLISNLVTEAEKKGIEPDDLVIVHCQVNKAPQIYGRIQRAYGRVNPYNTKPCHVEIVAMRKPLVVADAD